jgi:5'-deoxynucleotidase YfbR-like HD superfamily hydrolase
MPPKVSRKPAKPRKLKVRSCRPDWGDLLRASTHDVRRLDSVIRFSSIPVTFSESTASHSFWVALYSLMIWQALADAIPDNTMPPLEEVLRHAVTHDLGESVGGDVVRTLKYSTPEMKREVDRAEDILVKKLLPTEVKRTAEFIPSRDTLSIVKAADFLSLWQFMRREAARHNLEIMPYYVRMIKDLVAKEDEGDRLVGGLYKSMRVEADQVGVDCFGKLYFSKRWHREI